LSDYIKILNFDTELFGFKTGIYTKHTLSREQIREIIKECKDKKIKCLYLMLDINDFNTINTAIEYNFTYSDIRVIFENNIFSFENKSEIIRGYKVNNKVESKDVPYIIALGKYLSKKSRFYFDKNFPKKLAEKIYTEWILNSVYRRVADEAYIAREIKTNNPVGIITCKNRKKYGEIELIAVDKNHLGKRVGSLLMNYAFRYFKNNFYSKIRVKTQAKNIPALRFYQKNSFYIYKILLYFHLWIK